MLFLPLFLIFELRPSLDVLVTPSCYLLNTVQRRSMYGRTFLRVRYLEKREKSLSSAKEHATRGKKQTGWAVVSSFFSDRSSRGIVVARSTDRSLPSSEFLLRLPSVTRHFLPLHDLRSVFPSDGRRWKERDRAELAYSGRCTREHARPRHYRHRTIERNGRSDCFILSSASLAGRSGRRVTWTSTVTTRSGPAGSTSSRLSSCRIP